MKTFLLLAFTGVAFGIHAGRTVEDGELPYVMSIRAGVFDDTICGASIYTEEWAITAARCVRTYSPSQIFLVAADPQTLVNDPNEQIVNVDDIIVHEEYSNIDHFNDIALLHLDPPLVFNQYVAPIAPVNKVIAQDTPCNASGWGAFYHFGPPNHYLSVAEMPMLTDNIGEATYGLDEYVSDIMITAGNYADGGADACDGDEGGPLVCDGMLAGIISWGHDCGLPRFPRVFTDVYYFREWIEDNSNTTMPN